MSKPDENIVELRPPASSQGSQSTPFNNMLEGSQDSRSTTQFGGGSGGGGVNDHIEERIRRSEAETDTKFARMDGKLDLIINNVTDLKEQSNRTEDKVSGLKFWMFGAAIGIIGVVGAFMTYGISMLRLGLSQ